MSAQGLSQRRMSPDLTVDPAAYFGRDPRDLQNADRFGLQPAPEKDLYRVQYLYLMVFGNQNSSTDYGGIQVRASTHLYLEDGRVPVKFQRVMQRSAHRGAFLFDSSLEEGIYGGGGGDWADGGGYLSGFNPVENGAAYRNWEVEPVGAAQGRPADAQPGVLRWTTEIYLEVEGTNYADLSGVAQGIADPYSVVEVDEETVEAQQEWWEMTWNPAQSKYGAYDIHPPGRSSSKERAKRLHGKDVYVNSIKIGKITKDGRVYLAKKYADRYDGEFNGSHSREYLVENTLATYQALAAGRRIAKIDESPSAVHLATKQARPDDFDPVDPDDVDPDRRVREGGTSYILSLPEHVEDPTRQECRQDREIISHLGYSDPPYEHTYAEMWAWPGFRPIAEHGRVRTPQADRDDGQEGLDAFGGDDA
jgi:hypothetical protein